MAGAFETISFATGMAIGLSAGVLIMLALIWTGFVLICVGNPCDGGDE